MRTSRRDTSCPGSSVVSTTCPVVAVVVAVVAEVVAVAAAVVVVAAVVVAKRLGHDCLQGMIDCEKSRVKITHLSLVLMSILGVNAL